MAEKKYQKTNVYDLNHHYMSTKQMLQQNYVKVRDKHGREEYYRNAKGQYVNKYKAKLPLWMTAVSILSDMCVSKKNFVFRGSYKKIRDMIVKACPFMAQYDILHQLCVSMNRAAESGFLTIKRDESKTGCEYREITVNLDKIEELSVFDLDIENNATWKKYKGCSREHKFMKNRPFSSLRKLKEDFEKEEKKQEFKRKLDQKNYRCKYYDDVIKAFITQFQSEFSHNQKVKCYKSVGKRQDEELAKMYDSSPGILADDDGVVIEDGFPEIMIERPEGTISATAAKMLDDLYESL